MVLVEDGDWKTIVTLKGSNKSLLIDYSPFLCVMFFSATSFFEGKLSE